MGTICILIGLITLIAFTGVGFLISNMIAANQIYMLLFKSFSVSEVYVLVTGVCAFVGLLICLNLVMNGLIYNRVCKNTALIKKLDRH